MKARIDNKTNIKCSVKHNKSIISTVNESAEYCAVLHDNNNICAGSTQRGAQGEPGNGIVSITKTSSSGIVDTYTILFTNGTSTTFEVTNGSSIDTIEKTSTSGLVDTYTITLTNGDTSTFTVTNGEDGAAATIDVGTTTTGEPGTNASVVNSGTSSAAVFDFTIPRGDKGETGATGADGYSPTATVTQSNNVTTITITDKNGTTTESIDLSGIVQDIEDIQEVIPSQASSSNQLADKSFVNSSVATNTANFIGTFNSVAELEAYSGTLTNNDYAFVISTDSAGNTVYNRYKYTTATTPASWVFEYALNNSSFTSDQWAAINSGATTTNIGLAESALQPNDNISELVNDANYVTNSDMTTALGNKVSKAGDTMTGALESSSAIYLTNIASSVHSSTSRLYFGSKSSPTNYISANTSGAFGIYNSSQSGVTCYPGQNFFAAGTTNTTDLGRSQNAWKNLYLGGSLYSGNSNITAANLISGAGKGATSLQPNDNITQLTNNAGYITGITSSDVTTALGYTPYNSTNPDGYTTNVGTVTSVNNTSPDANGNVTISTASAISDLTDVTLTSLTDGQTLVYDSATSKWVNGNGGVSASYNSTTKTITFA